MTFPTVDDVYEANFGAFVFHLRFASEEEMTYTVITGPTKGTVETVRTTVIPIRPGVFIVYWQEADKTTVVHVEDFEQGVVYTNITQPDSTFLNLRGTLKQVQ